MAASTFYKKGYSEKPKGEGKFLSIKPDTVAKFVPLVGTKDAISWMEHIIWSDGGNSPRFPCIRDVDKCPGCEAGNKAGYRTVMPVVDIENKVIKYFSFGSTIANQLVAIEEAGTDIVGQLISVKRQGAGLSSKYTVASAPKRFNVTRFLEQYDENDLIASLGPATREGILEMMGMGAVPLKREVVEADDMPEITEEELEGLLGEL